MNRRNVRNSLIMEILLVTRWSLDRAHRSPPRSPGACWQIGGWRGVPPRFAVFLIVGAWLIAACGQSSVESPLAGSSETRRPAVTATPAPAKTDGSASSQPARSPSASRSPQPAFAPTGPTEPARVVRVVDGDTIVIDRGRGQEKLRYIGVDTPETVKPGSPVEWMGPQASAANRTLVEGRDVVLERDVSEYDRYGRLLRYVWLHDGAAWTLVNLALVAAGYAQVVTYPPDVKYVERYLAAQGEARDAGRGLWGEPPSSAQPSQPAGSAGSTVAPGAGSCDPAYPGVCIPPPPPDLDCQDVPYRRFTVLAPDPHRFDGDHDGIGCES